MRNHRLFVIFLVSMAGAIALANFLVTKQINNWLTWASFTYPLVFLITDLSNRLLGLKAASKIVLLGFCCGVLLSFISAPARIAMASGSAFLLAGVINLFVFDKLRTVNIWWLAPISSSAAASLLDTFIFFALAFIGTQVPWVSLAIGDLGIKLLMVIIFLPLYKLALNRILPPINTPNNIALS
ncbi:MAG: VUT family protein [Gammaproteobacteria bacterium]|nr:VUT family protein [Gammaproteobacteria bacterium]